MLLLGLFSEARSSGDKISSPSAKKNSLPRLSPKLSPSIVCQDASNLPLKSDDGRFRISKKSAELASWGLEDLRYITDQFIGIGFQGADFTIIKSSTKSTEGLLEKQSQQSASVIGVQKRGVKLGIPLGKLKWESSGLGNSVRENSNLVLVDN